MNQWEQIPKDSIIKTTTNALNANGIETIVVANRKEAKQKLFELLPPKAEVMQMTSKTLDTIGASEEINTSGRYNSVRNQLMAMDRKTQGNSMQKLGAAPDWAVGSVHAVTQDGKVLVASNSGSQLPAYVYGASHVLWVVGAQKIVKTIDEGMKRIYEYSLPLESERARKAYGVSGSFVSKLLIINKEQTPKRITMILVKEKLGF